jgi:catechol 2,3-dioxygenase-like lactoylglutathione lyase family enzyme
MAVAVSGLHHVTIRVQDPDRARDFYEKTLGLPFIEIPVDQAFVHEWKGNPAEGTLLATQIGSTFLILAPPLEGTPDDDRFSERRIGVDHLAFGVDDPAVLDEVVSALEHASVPTAGVETDPVLGKPYVAFRDPDNVQWEFFLAT